MSSECFIVPDPRRDPVAAALFVPLSGSIITYASYLKRTAEIGADLYRHQSFDELAKYLVSVESCVDDAVLKVEEHLKTLRLVSRPAANILSYRNASYQQLTRDLGHIARLEYGVRWFNDSPEQYDHIFSEWYRAAVTLHEECRWLTVDDPKPKSMLPIDVEAAAAGLHKSDATVKRWCESQKNPCHRAYKASGKWLIPAEDIPDPTDG